VASQAVLRRLHEIDGLPCRQIGASFRGGSQVRDLIGINVMTLPPKVAREFERMNVPAGEVRDRTGEEYHPELRTAVDPDSVRLDTLWRVEEKLVLLLDALEREDLDSFTPKDLVSFFAKRGGGDVLVPWSGEEIALSAAEGKIPRLEHWREALASRRIGLDSLMNLAGLNSFATDQKAMDDRVQSVLAKSR
jgi:transaldolase